MSNLILFWHRRDLRIADQSGIATANQGKAKITGVFCLDPNILKKDDVAPARVAYMLGCLQELQQSYARLGSQLLILYNDPQIAIPQLAIALNAQAVYWNFDVEPYARERDRLITDALKTAGIEVKNFWDQLLHPPETIRSGANQPYTVYTPFWKNWISHSKTTPIEPIQQLTGLSEIEQELAHQTGAIALPTGKDLGLVWEHPFLVEPGEKAAQIKLEEFGENAIYNYDQQRNFPGINGTSLLSAPLKFGTIGIRTVWDATRKALTKSSTDESRKNIQTWQQELAWREFYQHAIYNFPKLADGAYRTVFQNFPWDHNQEHFQAWCTGKTGYPIIDAAMRQLNQTGWMHNRCRMIVASFLTKDLIINWQWGEKYFMQTLYDGDLAANNGGWQWSASSGMDPKPLRIFNPATQAQKFDPQANYIRQWLPELAGLDTLSLLSGNITPLQRQALDYPAPIVDHNQQQRRFKQLYQAQKTEI